MGVVNSKGRGLLELTLELLFWWLKSSTDGGEVVNSLEVMVPYCMARECGGALQGRGDGKALGFAGERAKHSVDFLRVVV